MRPPPSPGGAAGEVGGGERSLASRITRAVAEVDLDLALAAGSPAEAMHRVVVGTVMVDPVLLALRRVAQEAASAERA